MCVFGKGFLLIRIFIAILYKSKNVASLDPAALDVDFVDPSRTISIQTSKKLTGSRKAVAKALPFHSHSGTFYDVFEYT